MAESLDYRCRNRTKDQWRVILSDLVAALSAYSGIELVVVSYSVRDDNPAAASASNCVDVRGIVDRPGGVTACGVVCATINFEEASFVSAELLHFKNGDRVHRPGKDVTVYQHEGGRWSGGSWAPDADGEWEAYTSESRWCGT